jgi:hypothetical protein
MAGAFIRTRQEVDHILDGNKFQRNHGLTNRRYDKSLGRKVAEVPATIIHKWLQEGIDIWSGECQDGHCAQAERSRLGIFTHRQRRPHWSEQRCRSLIPPISRPR